MQSFDITHMKPISYYLALKEGELIGWPENRVGIPPKSVFALYISRFLRSFIYSLRK